MSQIGGAQCTRRVDTARCSAQWRVHNAKCAVACVRGGMQECVVRLRGCAEHGVFVVCGVRCAAVRCAVQCAVCCVRCDVPRGTQWVVRLGAWCMVAWQR